MKLNLLSELTTAYKPSLDFYGDPNGNTKGTEDPSFLVGGQEDRERYASKTVNATKKKKKGKKK